MYQEFKGIRLDNRETIREEVTISKTGLLVTWLSIPSVLLVTFIFTYMPYIVRITFSKAFRQALMEQYEVDVFSDLNLSATIFDLVFGNIPTILIVLLCIPFLLLVIAWLAVCLYKTSQYFNCCLALTDRRIIGRANREELSAYLDEIVNVFIERSLPGKVFNYGNIVVHTKRKSVTFKNIHNPRRMYDLIMSYAENYAAH